MTNRELGLVGRERLNRAKNEQRKERMASEAPIRAEMNKLLARNNAMGAVTAAQKLVDEAEAEIIRRTEALKRYRLEAGLDARATEINNLLLLIDVAIDVLAQRRHVLASAQTYAATFDQPEQTLVDGAQPALVKKGTRR